MLSMTGFGQGEAGLSHGKARVELRAVNHRFLDLRVRAPRLPSTAQFAVEQVLKQRLVRGHIEALVSLHGTAIDAPALDRERARSAWAELQALRDEIDPAATLPLSLLSMVPDLFVAHPAFDEAALQLALTQATETACEELHRMRLIEGKALQAALLSILTEFQDVLQLLDAGQGNALEQARRRLAERIDALLGPLSGNADRGRLEQEVAFMAQRIDIAEEIARIFSHITQLTQIITPGIEPAGKRADFLLQELGREVNTVGSKLQDASLAKHVITLKSLVERMREQVQNVL